jgi:2-dehydro-3-deoxygluconokinase
MKRVVTFGEIMMRLSTPGFQRFLQARSMDVNYGGGEANVAVTLAQLGLNARHVTCFPDNDLGRAVAAYYRQHGVDFDHTVYQGQRLGLFFLEVGAGMRPSRIIYDRYESAFAHLDPAWFDWNDLLNDAAWFHWTGITPAISATAAEACLQALQTAHNQGVTISADVNYRRVLWQYGKTVQEVMPDLVNYCDVMVCTMGDAADIFGIQSETFEQMAEQMLARFPKAKTILATQRETLSASHNRLF